jgi:hypothetical protein
MITLLKKRNMPESELIAGTYHLHHKFIHSCRAEPDGDHRQWNRPNIPDRSVKHVLPRIAEAIRITTPFSELTMDLLLTIAAASSVPSDLCFHHQAQI